MKPSANFKDRVEHLVQLIPPGRVMTYGQIAASCGSPMAARIVGGIAHYGNPGLPWHRVVNKHGGCAVGYPGGVLAQREALEAERVEFTHNAVNLEVYLWQPHVQ